MPRTLRVSSENATFQHIETLRRNRQKRHRHGEFVVEGVRPITMALAHGWPIHAFVHAPRPQLSRWARELLGQSGAEVHYELPPSLLAKLTDRHEGAELLALAPIPADDLGRLPPREDLRLVVFDRPGNPGNLGSILRSIDALGAHGLMIMGHAADVYDPEVIRASTGSFFAVPTVRLSGTAALAEWLQDARQLLPRLQLVGASEAGTLAARDFDFSGPLVLAMGNETHGLSRALGELCDAMVQIPMTGSASSLNVAAATSILLYEVDTQRRQGGALVSQRGP